MRTLIFTMLTIILRAPMALAQAGTADAAKTDGFGKIFLQFFLATVIGSFLTFLFQRFRDNATKRDAVQAAKLELIKEVDELYRSSKQVKRMVRSRMRGESGEKLVKAGFYENQMDALSRIQLSLEQSRQTIRARTDFFDTQRQKRILYELRYTEAYLHDVVEDFEKSCVIVSNSNYKITNDCYMMNDFLGPRWLPEQIVDDFKIMEDGATAQERHDALRRIVVIARDNAYNRRYKSIADECLLLALREMRESLLDVPSYLELVKRLGLNPFSRWMFRSPSSDPHRQSGQLAS